MTDRYVTFKSQYLIVEEINEKHQPFYKEYTTKTPTLNYNSKPLHCPFTTKVISKSTKVSKHGYCENCCRKYVDYSQHIIEDEHREFARNDDHYKEIDDIIDELSSTDSSSDGERPLSPLCKIQVSVDSNDLDFTKESINYVVFEKDGEEKGSEETIEFDNVGMFIDELFD
ncbi:Cdc7p-Dbf4p kinase complex regulatory subunit [Binucleata daphniae]